MRSLVVALLAVVVVTAGLGCGGSSEEGARPPETVTEPPAADSGREAAPQLAGVSLAGEPIDLTDFRGRPTLINVWSSW